MTRSSLIALTLGMAACSPDYDLIHDTPPVNIDTSVDTPIDTDPQPIGDRPIAVCEVTPDSVQPPFETARFMGGHSYDPAGHDITSWVWTLTERPSGSAITLPNTPSDSDRTFMPDLGGTYTGHLVVTTDDNRSSEPCEVSLQAVPGQDFWIEMFWTHSGDDMDLHLLAPGGSLTSSNDCYYGNCQGSWNPLNWGGPGPDDDPSLDLDDIPGTGPENINIASPQPGKFTVVVHDYPGSVYNGENDTTVNIYMGGALMWSDTRPMDAPEDTYHYFATVDWPAQTITRCNDSGC